MTLDWTQDHQNGTGGGASPYLMKFPLALVARVSRLHRSSCRTIFNENGKIAAIGSKPGGASCVPGVTDTSNRTGRSK